MIKWPEPFRKQGQQLCNDGNTTVFFDAYNKDQLKQAVRDALEEAANALTKLITMAPTSTEAIAIALAQETVRALIKEI